MTALPTPDEMLAAAQAEMNKAYRALSDAADWLRSDWSPVGSLLTDEQARQRTDMQKAIAAAKRSIVKGR